MSVRKQDWQAERGEKDANRHRDLIKEEVKKRAIDSIANTPVVGKSVKIKVRIRGKKSYFFRPKQGGGEGDGSGEGEGEGMGQGAGDVGDIIGRRPNNGEGEGEGSQAGDQPGEDAFETEIELAELFEWLCEELGLPKLKKREGQEIAVKKGWKPSGVRKTGIPPRLKKKLTAKQAIKRNAGTVLGLKQILTQKLGKDPQLDDQVYLWAWVEAKFERDQAIVYLEKIVNGEIKLGKDAFKKVLVHLNNDDLRYKKFEEDIEYESNAVIIAIMDVSGSMTDEKKMIARSFYWWAFNFLRTVYENVKIVFITHHTDAKVVSEEDFFHTVESGGTQCYSGYELAKKLIETDFPSDRWNVYVMHFSDGEDWDTDKTSEAIKSLLPICNAVGYGEIMNDDNDSLLKTLASTLNLKKQRIEDKYFYVHEQGEQYFMGTDLESKEEIWAVIKAFFRKEEVEE